MLTVRETALGVYGAWRLALLDPRGMDYLDRTEAGFWRSFRVAVLVAPLMAVLVTLRRQEVAVDVDPVRFTLVESIAYVIGWVAFPIVAAKLADLLDREPDYVGYIVAYNWSAVPQLLLYLAIALIGSGGLLPDAAVDMVGLVGWVAIMGYVWFITRTALRIHGFAAAGIVVVDQAIGILIHVVAAAMERSGTG